MKSLPNFLGPHRSQRDFILTPQELRWVGEYLLSHDPEEASLRVGLPPKDGRRLLARRKIQEAISIESRRALTRQQIYLEDVLRNLVALRDADPNELVEVRRKPCRNCYGVDHEYQYTDLEHRHAVRDHTRRMAELRQEILVKGGDPESDSRFVPFDEKGGPGYTPHRPPCRGPDWEAAARAANPTLPPAALAATSDHSCPACFGDGELQVLVKDTRNLSYGGRLLYDGVKVGAAGAVEVKFRDRAWAEDRLLKYAGAFNDRRPTSDPNRVADDRLVEAVAALVEQGTLDLEALPAPDDPDDDDFAS